MKTKMITRSVKIRLFLESEISIALDIPLTSDQAKYLFKVMRLSTGQLISVIDGKTGEYTAEITKRNDKSGSIKIVSKIRDVVVPPNLWLLFSPLKKNRTDFIIEKATELGVQKIIPVITERTNSNYFRTKRMKSIIFEALEQCGGTYLPKLEEPLKLDRLLASWPTDRQLIFCDETLALKSSESSLSRGKLEPCAGILIGPEGGFSSQEGQLIRRVRGVNSITLGPRVLRADTAAVSAISIWQSINGDW